MRASIPSTPKMLTPEELDRIRYAAANWANAGFLPGLLSHIDALDAMIRDDENIPRRYVSHGGVTYCIWGTSSISAYEDLEAKVAALEAQLSTIRASVTPRKLERYDILTDHSDNDTDRHVTLDGEHTNANLAESALNNALQAAVLYKGLMEQAEDHLAKARLELGAMYRLETDLVVANRALGAAKVEIARLHTDLIAIVTTTQRRDLPDATLLGIIQEKAESVLDSRQPSSRSPSQS